MKATIAVIADQECGFFGLSRGAPFLPISILRSIDFDPVRCKNSTSLITSREERQLRPLPTPVDAVIINLVE